MGPKTNVKSVRHGNCILKLPEPFIDFPARSST